VSHPAGEGVGIIGEECLNSSSEQVENRQRKKMREPAPVITHTRTQYLYLDTMVRGEEE
jgi:hypothetical protein